MAFKRKDEDNTSGVKVKSSSTTPVATEESKSKGPQRGPKLRSGPAKSEEENATPATRPRTATRSRPAAKNNNMFIIGGVVLVAIVIIFVVSQGGTAPTPTVSNNPPAATQTPLSAEEQLKRDLQSQGLGSGSSSTSNTTGQISVTSDTMLRDIDGNDMPEMWTAKTIVWINDLVQYQKRRSVLDSGVELYWIEGTYRGMDVRMIVPYSTFRDMPEFGSYTCLMEIVETTTGQRVITYMQPDPTTHKRLLGQ